MMSSIIGFQHNIVPAGQRIKFVNAPARLVMRKRDIHPHLYEEAKVYCNGEHVLTISGTLEEYHVDIWSGNHPLFTGQTRTVTSDQGRLSRFSEKYADLGDLVEIPNLVAGGGPPPPAAAPKKKSKTE